jgi:hypothetical protein
MVDQEKGKIDPAKYAQLLIDLGVDPEVAQAYTSSANIIGNLEFRLLKTSWELETTKRLKQIYPDLQIVEDLSEIHMQSISYAKKGVLTNSFRLKEDGEKMEYYIRYDPDSFGAKYIIRESEHSFFTDAYDEIVFAEELTAPDVREVDIRSEKGIMLLCTMLVMHSGTTFSDAESPTQQAYFDKVSRSHEFFDLQEAIDNLPPTAVLQSEPSSSLA